VALLEEEQLDTIECESAEAALAVLLIGGQEIAMIFADVRLPGAMDGIDLAWEVKLRWPLLPIDCHGSQSGQWDFAGSANLPCLSLCRLRL
jgi:DNA-binding NtrC family response regulator